MVVSSNGLAFVCAFPVHATRRLNRLSQIWKSLSSTCLSLFPFPTPVVVHYDHILSFTFLYLFRVPCSLWEQQASFHSPPSQGHSSHPLQRNKSDRSSDRYSHRSRRKADPTHISYSQGRSTDYPVKSSSSGYFSSDMPGRMSASNSLQWKGSADTRIGNGIGDELGGKKEHRMRNRVPDSASEFSFNSDAPLLRKSSVASVDRHSYSESSQSSYSGSMNLNDPGYAGPVHTRSRSYHQGSPVPLLLDTGTPASSQSDMSDGQMRPPR